MNETKQAMERMAHHAAKQRYMHLVNKGRCLSGAERIEKDTLRSVLQSRYIKEGEQ